MAAPLTWSTWDPESVNAFQAVADVEPSSAGLCTLADLLHGSYLARVESALIAVRPNQFPHGTQWEIAGAVSDGSSNLVRGLGSIEQAARAQGVDVLSFITVHPGLSRMAQRQGFALTGYVLRKQLKGQ